MDYKKHVEQVKNDYKRINAMNNVYAFIEKNDKKLQNIQLNQSNMFQPMMGFDSYIDIFENAFDEDKKQDFIKKHGIITKEELNDIVDYLVLRKCSEKDIFKTIDDIMYYNLDVYNAGVFKNNEEELKYIETCKEFVKILKGKMSVQSLEELRKVLYELIEIKELVNLFIKSRKKEMDSIIEIIFILAKDGHYKKGQEFLKKYIEAFGLSEEDVKKYTSKMNALIEKQKKKANKLEEKEVKIEIKKKYTRDYNLINQEELKELRKSIKELVDYKTNELIKDISYDDFIVLISKMIRLRYSSENIEAFIAKSVFKKPELLAGENIFEKLQFYYDEETLSYLYSLIEGMNNAETVEDKEIWKSEYQDEINKLKNGIAYKGYKYELYLGTKVKDIAIENLRIIEDSYYNNSIEEGYKVIDEFLEYSCDIDTLSQIKGNINELKKTNDEDKKMKIVSSFESKYKKAILKSKYDYYNAYYKYKNR